jgi:hypothetical protein
MITAPIILWMWLASSPNVSIPTSHHSTRAECIAARKREVQTNVALNLGGGATYWCSPYPDKEK